MINLIHMPEYGLAAEYIAANWKGDGSHPGDWKPSKSTPAAGAYIGARWFFTDKFAVYSELGYLISVFNVGITFKF
jgi:hypothetical protein